MVMSLHIFAFVGYQNIACYAADYQRRAFTGKLLNMAANCCQSKT